MRARPRLGSPGHGREVQLDSCGHPMSAKPAGLSCPFLEWWLFRCALSISSLNAKGPSHPFFVVPEEMNKTVRFQMTIVKSSQ